MKLEEGHYYLIRDTINTNAIFTSPYIIIKYKDDIIRVEKDLDRSKYAYTKGTFLNKKDIKVIKEVSESEMVLEVWI